MGESARKPGCPELPETPLELLTPRPGEGFTAIDKAMLPVTGVLIGIATMAFYNATLRRPSWASIHLHILSGAIGYGLGTFIRDQKFASKSERDAVLKYYITLHPEDFPPFERKRFSDVYLPFSPMR